MRVLIADDDVISRRLMCAAVERAGHAPTAFEDGEALFDAYLDEPTTLVVTDWIMPRMTGIELCERVRSTPGVPYTHVIIITTLSTVEHTLTAFQAGADEIVAKPLQPSVLAARLAAVERAMNRQEEIALRDALQGCQNNTSHDHVALYTLLGSLAANARRQRAFARCRAFLRRQLAAAQNGGASRGDQDRLRGELRELERIDDGGT